MCGRCATLGMGESTVLMNGWKLELKIWDWGSQACAPDTQSELNYLFSWTKRPWIKLSCEIFNRNGHKYYKYHKTLMRLFVINILRNWFIKKCTFFTSHDRILVMRCSVHDPFPQAANYDHDVIGQPRLWHNRHATTKCLDICLRIRFPNLYINNLHLAFIDLQISKKSWNPALRAQPSSLQRPNIQKRNSIFRKTVE